MPRHTLNISIEAQDEQHAQKINECVVALLQNLDLKLLNEVNPAKLGAEIGKYSKNPFVIGIIKKKLK